MNPDVCPDCNGPIYIDPAASSYRWVGVCRDCGHVFELADNLKSILKRI